MNLDVARSPEVHRILPAQLYLGCRLAAFISSVVLVERGLARTAGYPAACTNRQLKQCRSRACTLSHSHGYGARTSPPPCDREVNRALIYPAENRDRLTSVS